MKNRFLFAFFLGIGVALTSWVWANLLAPGLIYSNIPDPIMLSFSAISFLCWAVLHFLLFRNPDRIDSQTRPVRSLVSTFALLVLVSFSIQLQIPYWLSRSSTTALVFIVYLPYAVICIVAAALTTWLVVKAILAISGRVSGRFPAVVKTLAVVVLFAANVSLSNYGRFSLAPELGIETIIQQVDETFTKRRYFDRATHLAIDIGAITSIENRKCSEHSDAVMTITGRSGALLATPDGEVRQRINFAKTSGSFAYPSDMDGDGRCEFVDHPGGWSPVGLIDSNGGKVFSYGKYMGGEISDLTVIDYSPLDVVAFDYGANGIKELLIPLLVVGGSLTHIVSWDGEFVESLTMNFRGCIRVDDNPNRYDELVCFRRRKSSYFFAVYDELLNIKREYPVTVQGDHSQVKLVKWPDTGGSWHSIYSSSDGLRVLDISTGKNSVASSVENLNYLNVWFVRFDKQQSPFLVTSKHVRNTVTISIYGDKNELRYQETLLRGGTAAVLPFKDGVEHFLMSERLASGEQTVSEYLLVESK